MLSHNAQCCSVLFNVVQASSILSRVVQSCPGLLNLVQLCPLLSNLVQSCLILSIYVHCCPVLFKLVQSCHILFVLSNINQAPILACVDRNRTQLSFKVEHTSLFAKHHQKFIIDFILYLIMHR